MAAAASRSNSERSLAASPITAFFLPSKWSAAPWPTNGLRRQGYEMSVASSYCRCLSTMAADVSSGGDQEVVAALRLFSVLAHEQHGVVERDEQDRAPTRSFAHGDQSLQPDVGLLHDPRQLQGELVAAGHSERASIGEQQRGNAASVETTDAAEPGRRLPQTTAGRGPRSRNAHFSRRELLMFTDLRPRPKRSLRVARADGATPAAAQDQPRSTASRSFPVVRRDSRSRCAERASSSGYMAPMRTSSDPSASQP